MTYLIILVVIGLLLRFFEPQIKGKIGENRVIKQLAKLNSDQYIILNDIMIPTEKGTSQIDHLVLSPYGIFVIETKNYSGWIHGGENSEYWTQTIYKKKNKFRNPIRQNWGHIYALKEILAAYPDVPFIPIVVFAGSAKLKNVNTQSDVIYEENLYDTIIGHQGKAVISPIDMEQMANLLRQATIDDKQSRKQHNQLIKAAVKDRKQKENAGICPKCGAQLVKKSGKYGEFYGCSTYPKCRYIMKI